MTALLEVAFLKLFYQVCAEQVPSFGPYSVLLHVGLSRGLSITIFAVDVSAPLASAIHCFIWQWPSTGRFSIVTNSLLEVMGKNLLRHQKSF